ncbi:hypothetical protein NDU88_005383, partial [Pleurodeles waltl]
SGISVSANVGARPAMTRGNQRELARLKNLKKTTDKAKKQEDGLSAAARKQ